MAQTFDNPKIARLYADVPAAQVERLLHFRATYPPVTTVIDGVDWEYIDTKEGSAPLLLMPGAMGTAESAWQAITRLAATHRVIVPSYAPVPTLAGMMDGIAAILRQVGIERVDVLGGSGGGIFAQAFVRRYPDLTHKLILSNTLHPDPKRGETIVKALRWMRWMPTGVLRMIFKKRLSGLLPEGSDEAKLLAAYFYEYVEHHLSKKNLLNLYTVAADFDRHCHFTPNDLDEWPGKVLLIMADDDPSTPEESRAQMRALYPQAQVHMFHGTGHAASVLRQDEYYDVVESFLAQEAERSMPG